MYGVLVPVSSDPESEKAAAFSCASRQLPERRRARGRVQLFRLSAWFRVLLVATSCCLPLALSGCVAPLVKGASTGEFVASPNAVTFGAVPLGQTATANVSLVNQSSSAVQVTQLSLTGQSFLVSGMSVLPITVAAGESYNVNVKFSPAATGAAAGQLMIASDATSNGTMVINLSGTGSASGTASTTSLSSLSCTSSALLGSTADACTVTLNAAAGSDGLTVSLASSNSAITVPTAVAVPAGGTSVGFTATASSVITAQMVTLTATASGVSETFILQLGAAVPTLSVNATSVAFGDVVINTSATQSVVLTSTGVAPVTINGATVMGAGFTMSGAAFPATLNPGQSATLNLMFDPTAVGALTGQLTVTSNSSTSDISVINLSGTGTAAPVVTVAVTPPTASTSLGGTQQFAASVTGSSDTAVSWVVSGSGCSGTACGTISSNGLYTAPTTVPSPATISISAASVADPSAFGTAIDTISDPSTVGTQNQWLAGVAAAAASYGCKDISVQQQSTESLTDAISRFELTASEGSCLVLWPISTNPNLVWYSLAWGGKVNGKDILYISDVGRLRIWNGVDAGNN